MLMLLAQRLGMAIAAQGSDWGPGWVKPSRRFGPALLVAMALAGGGAIEPGQAATAKAAARPEVVSAVAVPAVVRSIEPGLAGVVQPTPIQVQRGNRAESEPNPSGPRYPEKPPGPNRPANSETPPASPGNSGSPQPAATPPLRLILQPPQLTLISPGTGDLQPRRLKLAVGQSQAIRMTMDVKAFLKIADQSPTPMPVPKTTIQLDSLVDEVLANGDVSYHVTYNKISVDPIQGMDPAMAAGMRQVFEGIEGLRINMVSDDRGSVRSLEIVPPAKMDAQLRLILEQLSQQFTQSMNQMSVLLPIEPIGVGARWQVKSAMEVSGIKFEQTVTYTLNEIQGDRLKVAADLSQTAPEQEIQAAGAPGVKLKRLTTTGNGQMEIPLDRPLPDRGSIKVQSNSELAGPGVGAIKTDTTVEVVLTPIP